MAEELFDLETVCAGAAGAKYEVQKLSTEVKNRTLNDIADLLTLHADDIIMENAKDIAAATARGISMGMVDRLLLDRNRISGIAEGLRQVAGLPDPNGEVTESFEAAQGLKIDKVRVPMGVIGIIYESRPNVTADAFALCFKSGNAVILKGGSDAINSNKAITLVIKEGLKKNGITESAIELITSTDRETTHRFMQMREYVDVLIPRGSAGLIRAVVSNSKIPVIETGAGNCHIYIDESADLDKAVPIILNAKTQRLGTCNTCESLVVHEKVRDSVFVEVAKALQAKNVEIRGDEKIREVFDCTPATEEDFKTEYLDLIISAKTVSSIDEAIEHINRYSTGHSESIITQDPLNAERFLHEIDSACVYVNSSTRFTDGFQFGFGAEIGISTQKLHARGPMGLRELTSYKYLIRGNGQVRC